MNKMNMSNGPINKTFNTLSNIEKPQSFRSIYFGKHTQTSEIPIRMMDEISNA